MVVVVECWSGGWRGGGFMEYMPESVVFLFTFYSHKERWTKQESYEGKNTPANCRSTQHTAPDLQWTQMFAVSEMRMWDIFYLLGFFFFFFFTLSFRFFLLDLFSILFHTFTLYSYIRLNSYSLHNIFPSIRTFLLAVYFLLYISPYRHFLLNLFSLLDIFVLHIYLL